MLVRLATAVEHRSEHINEHSVVLADATRAMASWRSDRPSIPAASASSPRLATYGRTFQLALSWKQHGTAAALPQVTARAGSDCRRGATRRTAETHGRTTSPKPLGRLTSS
jgi:hypothetical protein